MMIFVACQNSYSIFMNSDGDHQCPEYSVVLELPLEVGNVAYFITSAQSKTDPKIKFDS